MTPLEQIVQLLEAKSKLPGVMSLKGVMMEKRCARDLRAYFEDLGASLERVLRVPYHVETTKYAIEITARSVVRRKQTALRTIIEKNYADALLAADSQDVFHEAGNPNHGKHGWFSSVSDAISAVINPEHDFGTPYNKLNCSQFACKITGHASATAKELYDEGKPGTEKDMQPGDIIAWPHGHVAVMTDKGLMDSTPERGVGYVSAADRKDAWYSGEAHIIRGGKIKEADPIKPVDPFSVDYIGMSAEQAAEYAAEHAGDLVTGIDATTVDRIANSVADAILNQNSPSVLSKAIRDVIADFTKSRADLIARTEMADAFGDAALKKLERLGIEGKQLIPSPDACPTCLAIVADGPVPVDEPFVDDDGEEYDRSPIHPACRCATVGARLDAE